MRNAKILLASVLAIGASACGLSESKYEERVQEASCEKLDECGFVDSVDACLELEGEDVDTSSCEYDSGKAKECVDAIEAQSCEDILSPPAACSEVYTNCDTSSGNNTSNTSNNMSNATNNGGGSNNTTM